MSDKTSNKLFSEGTPKVKDRIVTTFFYLGRSSSSITGWVVHAREKVVTILSFTLGVPRPAQLDGWYTAGRKSLLFYLVE
jgi:hypothetical protein